MEIKTRKSWVKRHPWNLKHEISDEVHNREIYILQNFPGVRYWIGKTKSSEWLFHWLPVAMKFNNMYTYVYIKWNFLLTDWLSNWLARAIELIFFHCLTLLQPDTCLLACSMYNAFFMDLLLSSLVSNSSLLAAKGVNLVAAHDGFPL